jgi:exopolysaccharide biosynthesis polyprenyl glycosylphosphotransferase
MPLIHVSYPAFEGVKRLSKRVFDLVGSTLLILATSPILIAVAIAVKRSSPGNIIYRQQRIGRGGVSFGMLKFRSMAQDADDQLESLLDAQGKSDTPLFKVTNDPRITPIGHTLRRYSLDELPQLFNVFLGEMSLVGPRPQRAAEVALYDDAAHRRLIMKPGMSGLWQVSGRSNLSWEDSIRLDLYYVENWSLTTDITILWRTVRAVVTPGSSAV